jgi:RhoGAP domain
MSVWSRVRAKQPPNNRDRLAHFMDSVKFMFERQHINHFLDIGTCYHKASIVSSRSWNHTEVVIVNGTFVFYDCDGESATCLDLRQVRSVQLKELDPAVINVSFANRLYVAVDCVTSPVFVTRSSEDETKALCKMLKKQAFDRTRHCLEDQQLTKDHIPVVMETCMNFIYAFGLKSEGIYRISGEQRKVNKLVELFKKNAHSVILRYAEYDEHDVASAIKQFIRTMKKPLLGRQSVGFLTVSDIVDEAVRHGAYKELLNRLPSIQYQTLRRLIGHLHVVQSCARFNKMSSANLAMVWGRNILVDMTTEQSDFLQKEHKVTNDLILGYDELFCTSEKERVSALFGLSIITKFSFTTFNYLLSNAIIPSVIKIL